MSSQGIGPGSWIKAAAPITPRDVAKPAAQSNLQATPPTELSREPITSPQNRNDVPGGSQSNPQAKAKSSIFSKIADGISKKIDYLKPTRFSDLDGLRKTDEAALHSHLSTHSLIGGSLATVSAPHGEVPVYDKKSLKSVENLDYKQYAPNLTDSALTTLKGLPPSSRSDIHNKLKILSERSQTDPALKQELNNADDFVKLRTLITSRFPTE
jgi:hypothetical protein